MGVERRLEKSPHVQRGVRKKPTADITEMALPDDGKMYLPAVIDLHGDRVVASPAA